MRVGLTATAACCAFGLHVAAQPVALKGFIEKAEGSDIVVLGEIHDNAQHHHNQAAIVSALQPAALVFEMIPQASEDEVNSLREDGASRTEIAEALDWSESGWPDFSYYAEILEAAPHARVFGAGQPIEDVRRAMEVGAAAAFGPDAAAYGLDRPLPEAEQRVLEADLGEAHCGKLAPALLPGMVEAQRFRDAGLADAALWARTMTGDGEVVVIAGSGHADKLRGMPAAVAIADPTIRVLSLGQFEAPPADPKAYDAVLLAPPAERGDPCATIDSPEG